MNKRPKISSCICRNLICLGLAIFILAAGGFSYDDNEPATNYKFNKAFFSRFGHDFGKVVSSPVHWKKRDFARLVVFTGTGLMVVAFDQRIKDWTQEHRTAFSEDASSVFEKFGNGAYLLGFSAVLYAAGEIGNKDGLRKTALLSVESMATASAIVWATKLIVGRARPYTGESPSSFHMFSIKASYNSFPSGHAAAAFAVATTISQQTKSIAVDVLAYSLATLVGLSRIHDNKHWASSAFIGSALGYFVGKKISDLNRPGRKETIGVGFQLNRSRQALTLNIAF
jgi:hypothetical protein